MNKPSLLFRNARLFRWALTWFPPYWDIGIRVAKVTPDFSRELMEIHGDGIEIDV